MKLRPSSALLHCVVGAAAGSEADTARQWCLRYNECDVAAQAAIRDGLRSGGG